MYHVQYNTYLVHNNVSAFNHTNNQKKKKKTVFENERPSTYIYSIPPERLTAKEIENVPSSYRKRKKKSSFYLCL